MEKSLQSGWEGRADVVPCPPTNACQAQLRGKLTKRVVGAGGSLTALGKIYIFAGS